MEGRSARSRRRVSTLTLGEAWETKGASEFWRRWVLRARRMMCWMPVEANFAATCWGWVSGEEGGKGVDVTLPMPGPAPKRMRVRVMVVFAENYVLKCNKKLGSLSVAQLYLCLLS